MFATAILLTVRHTSQLYREEPWHEHAPSLAKFKLVGAMGTFATPCETASSTLARADMASYDAKRAGRNSIRILLESIDQDSSTTPIPAPHHPPITGEALPMVRRPMPILEDLYEP
jgi:hypothetical protein